MEAEGRVCGRVRIVKPLARAIRARLGSVCGFSSGLDGTNFRFFNAFDFGRASSTVQCSKFDPPAPGSKN